MVDENAAAVYVSWLTFLNALTSLAQGLPNQIDRSSFPGLSGGVQSQLFAGLKFLGLITDDGKPTAQLHSLAVPDESARKLALKSILEECYADLFALDLAKTTPKQLADCMADSYNVTGDTKDRAVRFFLQAATYVGIPLSRYLRVPGASTPTQQRVRRRVGSAKPKLVSNDEPVAGATTATAGARRVITLESGGTLSLIASIDLFQLTPSDRTFVFGLIDAFEKYEKDRQPLA